MAEVLVLSAHPHRELSRVNRRLAKAAAKLGEQNVEVRDLYTLYPDYLIDVEAEQARLMQAKLIVWLHPIHWYSMPALMKLWVDDVLSFGWAYGPGGEALQGKDLWLVTTTGGPQESYHPASYNRYFFDAFMPPYEQTATLCGMRFAPPLVLHGAHKASEEQLQRHTAVFTSRLLSYPHWPELADMETPVDCEVPVEARPEEVEDSN